MQNPFEGGVVWMHSNGSEYQNVEGLSGSPNTMETDGSTVYLDEIAVTGSNAGRIMTFDSSGQHVVSSGGVLSEVEGMTIFYTNGGSGNAAAPPSQSWAAFQFTSGQAQGVAKAQEFVCRADRKTPASDQSLLWQEKTVPAPLQEEEPTLEAVAKHQLQAGPKAVDEIFAGVASPCVPGVLSLSSLGDNRVI